MGPIYLSCPHLLPSATTWKQLGNCSGVRALKILLATFVEYPIPGRILPRDIHWSLQVPVDGGGETFPERGSCWKTLGTSLFSPLAG